MHYLLAAVDQADRAMLDRARETLDHCQGHFGRDAIREINRRWGTDVATAALYLHFESKLPVTGKDWLPADATDAPGDESSTDDRPLLVLIAPGAFYKEHPETGADGSALIELSRQQREAGVWPQWQCERIATESLGTVDRNADLILDHLRQKTRSHRVILVSLSKGTSDARAAQSRDPNLFAELEGWVSVSGVVHGTPMANWLLDRWRLRVTMKLMLWYHQADQQAIVDMRRGDSERLNDPFVESAIPLIHVATFPLRRHLSCLRSRLWHRRLRVEGPTDGVVMLEDLLRVPGTVLPIWGADHYLQSEWDVSAAVCQIVTNWGRRGGSPKSMQPKRNVCDPAPRVTWAESHHSTPANSKGQS